MIEYNDNTIFYEGVSYDFKGLNTSHILWHLQELYKPEAFLNNLNETYTIPKHIHYMSIAEGTDFDAVLIDNCMFRYNKLEEADKEEIQEYINKYAYATALLKLNECSKVIGCGLEHEYSLDESYSFISKSYDKLFENTYHTDEKGRIVESFGYRQKIWIYEGNNNYSRGYDDIRLSEYWKDSYSHDKLEEYYITESVQDGNDAIITVFDKDEGAYFCAKYVNTKANILEANVNLPKLLKRNNLVESYRKETVGKIYEYQQPFTKDYATITSYEPSGNTIKLNMRDAFGNTGTVIANLTIPADEFVKKFKRDLNSITSAITFEDGVDETADLFTDASEFISSFNKRVAGKSFTPRDKENQFLSYKVAGFIPYDGEKNIVSKLGNDKFRVTATYGDKLYNIVYSYDSDENIDDFIQSINDESEDYDFGVKSDVISFWQVLDTYGEPMKSYPTGISTKERFAKKEEQIMEGEGVQTTDIAPKTDQNLGGLMKVKMKKKKVVESDIVNYSIKDLLIESVSPKDEFYGSRGFIRDEKGRYHFGDYYITESGKVVHKSKLKESLDSDAAGDAYYKVNEAALKLQEVKPYIEEDSEQEKLYNKIMIDLNELQVSFTKSNLKEALFKDIDGSNGIRSYYEMLWGEEPQSEYDKLLLQYMKKSDEIREELAAARKAFGGNTKNPEYKKLLRKLSAEDEKNHELRAKAEKIPEDERGPLYQDFLKIDKANNDEFAQMRGYSSYEEYEKNLFNESVNQDTVDKLRRSKYYSGESLVQSYIRLQNQKDELEKQGKLTDRLRYELDSRIEDLLLKSEATGQKAKEEPKVKHDDDYCNQAAADFVGDKMSDEFGANWRDLPQDEMIEAIKKYTNEYGEANAQPEYANEDFYGDEADYNKVYDILLGR